jgi:hypothetical protein
VESGEIMFATSKKISLAGSRVVELRVTIRTTTTRPKDKELERMFVGRWAMFSVETGRTTLYVTLSSDHKVSTNSKPSTKGKWDVVGNEVRVIMNKGEKYVIRQRSGKFSWEKVKPGADWDDPPELTRGFKKLR